MIKNKEQREEKEIAIEVKTKDNELDIKSESAIEEENMAKEKNWPKKDEIKLFNSKESENEFVTPKLKKEFSINFDDNTDIYGVQELSNKRILSNGSKIYSLETGKLINEISHNKCEGVVEELKNNDLLIYSSRKIYVYKLAKNNNYELYQIIDEYKQGTFKKKEKPQEEWCECFRYWR